MDPNRWEVLERYSRWKHRIRWSSLPEDIVSAIAAHLDEHNVLCLVRALVDDPQDNPEQVPSCVRPLWIRCMLCDSFRRFVYTHVSEEALYHSRDISSSVLFVDWSCFSDLPASPVAEFLWRDKRPHVLFHETRLIDVLAKQAKKNLPVVRLTVHQHLLWGGKSVLHPSPFLTRLYSCIPPPLLCHVGR